MTILNVRRSIDQIAVTSRDSRIVGFTSVRHGSGVSTVSRRVAKSMASGGARTLLVPLAALQASPSVGCTGAAAAGILKTSVAPSVHGYDLVVDSNSAFGPLNTIRLRELLDIEFADYDRIILDLAPICDEVDTDSPGTVALSTICDRLLLVCVIGVDRGREITEAVSLLRGSGATISGIVSNEYKRVDVWDMLRKRTGVSAAL